MTTKLEQVARGLLIDALITYVAILKERKHESEDALEAWSAACAEHIENITVGESDETRLGNLLDKAAVNCDVDDEHLELLIDERRGLIRETMRAELEALDDADASAPPSDSCEIQREVEG